MEEDTGKEETNGQPRSPRFPQGETGQLVWAGQGNEPPAGSGPSKELSWWNGREVKFEDIMDL